MRLDQTPFRLLREFKLIIMLKFCCVGWQRALQQKIKRTVTAACRINAQHTSHDGAASWRRRVHVWRTYRDDSSEGSFHLIPRVLCGCGVCGDRLREKRCRGNLKSLLDVEEARMNVCVGAERTVDWCRTEIWVWQQERKRVQGTFIVWSKLEN